MGKKREDNFTDVSFGLLKTLWFIVLKLNSVNDFKIKIGHFLFLLTNVCMYKYFYSVDCVKKKKKKLYNFIFQH